MSIKKYSLNPHIRVPILLTTFIEFLSKQQWLVTYNDSQSLPQPRSYYSLISHQYSLDISLTTSTTAGPQLSQQVPFFSEKRVSLPSSGIVYIRTHIKIVHHVCLLSCKMQLSSDEPTFVQNKMRRMFSDWRTSLKTFLIWEDNPIV